MTHRALAQAFERSTPTPAAHAGFASRSRARCVHNCGHQIVAALPNREGRNETSSQGPECVPRQTIVVGVGAAHLWALDSAKAFEEYEKFMQELMKVMTEGRKEGAKQFFIVGDLNIELGFSCEDDEMKEIYWPQCWFGVEAGPGGLKRSMLLEILTDFGYKAMSTWLICDGLRDKAFARAALGKNERSSQLDCILGVKDVYRNQHTGPPPCVHNYQRRRRASSKNKKVTWVGRMETSQRGRQNQVSEEGDGGRRDRRMKRPPRGPEAD